jgi:hypothetical protein
MNYKYILQLVLLLIISNQNVTAQSQDSTSRFLNLFEEVDWKGLQIYSPRYDFTDNEFEGLQIPNEFHHYFDNLNFISYSLNDGGRIFAVYRFSINSNTIGLIVRNMSMYSETAVSIILFDLANNISKSRFRLADSYGDGMWLFAEDAWLLDLNNDNLPDIVKRKNEWWEDDNEKQHTKSTFTAFQFDSVEFVPFETRIDTTKFKVFKWSY